LCVLFFAIFPYPASTQSLGAWNLKPSPSIRAIPTGPRINTCWQTTCMSVCGVFDTGFRSQPHQYYCKCACCLTI
jgi:hypothetical protein